MKTEKNMFDREFQEMLKRVDVRELKNKKVLVTGANGFLGEYIVGAISLANRKNGLGCTIDAVGLNTPKPVIASILEQDKNVTYKQINLSKPFELKGYDFIFHAAGYGQPARFINDPYSMVAINIDASKRLIEGSPKAVFVFFSSGEIYGEVPEEFIPTKETYNGNCPIFAPRGVYAEAKRLGEALCEWHIRNHGTKIKIVRISLTYGPGLPLDDTRVMSDFIKKAILQKEISMLDAGKAVKSYGYVTDTAAMILHVALHGKETVYNVGGKSSVSIAGLAKKIAAYCKVKYKAPADDAPRLVHIGKDPKVIRLDLKKVTHEMRKFDFMPFDEGLKRTIEWTKLLISARNPDL